MRADLEKQIKQKQKEIERLRQKWVNAKKKKDDIAAMSIEESGKSVKTDLEILQRRLKMLNMGSENPVNPYANIKPLTPPVKGKRGRKPVSKTPDKTPFIPKPYKDD